MPRNASGSYTLPSGNPVVSGTLIDATWANNTLADLGNEVTDSLSRSGEGAMLAPLRITDGVQATPSLAFSNEPSSGLYRAGSNEWWAVAAGVQNLRFTNTGLTTRAAAGAVGTPSIAAFNDTDTGIYFPGANELAIATGGAARMTFDSAGAVAVPGTFTLSGGTANGVLYLNGSKVATSGAALVFDGTNLGIGTASPVARLDVFKTSSDTISRTNAVGAFGDYVSLGAGLLLQQTLSSPYGFALQAANAANSVQFPLLLNPSGGNVGIGTASPTVGLTVQKDNGSGYIAAFRNTAGSPYITLQTTSGITQIQGINSAFTATNDIAMQLSGGNLGLGTASPSAKLDVSGQIFGVSGFASYTPDGLFNANARPSRIATPGSGPPSVLFGYLDNGGGQYNPRIGFKNGTASTAAANDIGNDTSGNFVIGTGSTTATTRVWLNQSGNLGIGDPPTAGKVNVNSTRVTIAGTNAATNGGEFIAAGAAATIAIGSGTLASYVWTQENYPMVFATNATERGRFSAGGDFLVNTTNVQPGTSNVVGFAVGESGYISVSRDSGVTAEFNRKTNDGDIIVFRQDGTQEGSISVSGNTISYNAFAGSHWSQLQDGSKPDILRGTVMESINELCVWPDENNERLPKSKISDTAGSKKVYGVFMAWDNDWTETNDMYVTAVGAFICRVNGSITVQEGDLLESNGDGTARVQADDIIRSSTIGKVTSTVKTHQYDDGSYCVPTVLYCG